MQGPHIQLPNSTRSHSTNWDDNEHNSERLEEDEVKDIPVTEEKKQFKTGSSSGSPVKNMSHISEEKTIQ